MKTLKYTFLAFLYTAIISALSINLYANPGYQKNNRNPDSHISKNDLVILEEHDEINITGKRETFAYFTFKKKVKYKILSEKGLAHCESFILPHNYDASFINHYPAARNYTNVLSNLKINFFKADIFAGGVEHRQAKIKEVTENVEMVIAEDDIVGNEVQGYYRIENGMYGRYERMHYQIANLKVGDELQVEYSYGADYDQNFLSLSSFRFFFHGAVYKNKYTMTLTHHPDLDFKMAYHNNSEPSDSIVGKDTKRYRWIKNNLDGCMNEAGGRAYLDLPYVIYRIRPVKTLYQLYNSFEVKHIPFYAIFAYEREKDHLGILKGVHHGAKLKEFVLLDKFVKNETENISDSTGYLQLRKMHNTIVDDFSFDNDINYFKEEDTRKPRMGEYLLKNTLRDINRYNTYVALISKINLQYFTAYLCDNRSGNISNNFFRAMHQSDYLFAVMLKNNSLIYLYPKKSKFGYYLNELPFYFENTNSLLVYIDDYLNYKKPIQEENRYKAMPSSELKDNTRTNSILAKANVDSLTINFRGRINLSGQYSTMTRGLYLHDYKDPTVNDCYNKKIWEINKDVTLKSTNTTMQKKVFPFSAKVDMQYSSYNLISKDNDKYILDLSNWFNHIIYRDIDAGDRKLDFYADFKGSDSYTYNIQFDKNIQLLNSLENDTISNEFGEYILNVTQPAGNVVKITSLFITKNEKVKSANINYVQSIYDKIIALNKSTLEFKVE